MPMPSRLDEDVESLRCDGREIEVIEDGSRYYVVIKRYDVPAYEPSLTDLMVMTDYQYPQSKMDMFWTDPPLRRKDGGVPQSAEHTENYGGRDWQRWSWHYPAWDPSCHNLHTHLEVVKDRLSKGT